MLDLLIEHAVPLFVLIISLGFFRDCGGSVKLKVVFILKQICFNFCFPLTNIVRKEKTLKIVLTCCVQI